MFKSQVNLFNKITCPKNDGCVLLNCPFSHPIGRIDPDTADGIRYTLKHPDESKEKDSSSKRGFEKVDDYDNPEYNFDGFVYNSDLQEPKEPVETPSIKKIKPSVDTSSVLVSANRRKSAPGPPMRKKSTTKSSAETEREDANGDVLLINPKDVGTTVASMSDRSVYLRKIVSILVKQKVQFPKREAIRLEFEVAQLVEAYNYREMLDKFVKALVENKAREFFAYLQDQIDKEEEFALKRAEKRSAEEEQRLLVQEAEDERARLAMEKDLEEHISSQSQSRTEEFEREEAADSDVEIVEDIPSPIPNRTPLRNESLDNTRIRSSNSGTPPLPPLSSPHPLVREVVDKGDTVSKTVSGHETTSNEMSMNKRADSLRNKTKVATPVAVSKDISSFPKASNGKSKPPQPLPVDGIEVDKDSRTWCIKDIMAALDSKTHRDSKDAAVKHEHKIANANPKSVEYYDAVDGLVLKILASTDGNVETEEIIISASKEVEDADLPSVMIRGTFGSISRQERESLGKALSDMYRSVGEKMPNDLATRKENDIASSSTVANYSANMKKLIGSLKQKSPLKSNEPALKDISVIIVRQSSSVNIDKSERRSYTSQISALLKANAEPTPNKSASEHEHQISQKSNDNTYNDNVEGLIDIIKAKGDYISYISGLKDSSQRKRKSSERSNSPIGIATKSKSPDKSSPVPSAKDVPFIIAKTVPHLTVAKKTRIEFIKKVATLISQREATPSKAAIELEKNVALSSTDTSYQQSMEDLIEKLFKETTVQPPSKISPEKQSTSEVSRTPSGSKDRKSPSTTPSDTKPVTIKSSEEAKVRFISHIKIEISKRSDFINIMSKAFSEKGSKSATLLASHKEYEIALASSTTDTYMSQMDSYLHGLKNPPKDVPIGLPKPVKPNPPASTKERRAFIDQIASQLRTKRPDILTPLKEAIAIELDIASVTSNHTYPQTVKKYIFDLMKGRNTHTKLPKNLAEEESKLLQKLKEIIISKQVLAKNSYFVDIPKVELVEGYDPSVRECFRCGAKFRVVDQLKDINCVYHFGKQLQNNKYSGGPAKIYDCCGGSVTETSGCKTSNHHVFKYDYGFEMHNSIPFKKLETLAPSSNAYKAVGIDCEMGFTTKGFEVLRVTVVDFFSGEEIFDSLVRPSGEVIDLNTHYSGIAELGDDALPFKDMLDVLFRLIDCNTILIGHGFENDLNVLRLIPKNVVDTSILYPKNAINTNRKWSLKDLSAKYLSRRIQGGQHDSTEDALAAIDIVKYHLKE